MSNREDFDAIKDFFTRMSPKTLAGGEAKTAFMQWAPTAPSFIGTVSDEDLAKASKFRTSYNMAEMPKETTEQAAHAATHTKEEDAYFMTLPVVNTTGMSPAAAKAAVQKAAATAPPPPPSLSMFVAPKPATAKVDASGNPVLDAGDPKTWLKKGSNDKVGATNGPVHTLQRLLGFTGKDVDGKFGKNTEAKVKSWQTAHGLPATGIVDGITAAKMSLNMNADGTPATSGSAAIAALTGQNTVKPAVAAAKPKLKPAMAAVTTGAVTGTPPSAFQNAVQQANQIVAPAQKVEASMVSGLGKMPTWGWAGIIGATVAGLAYAVFGKPRMTDYGTGKEYEKERSARFRNRHRYEPNLTRRSERED